MHLKRIVLRQYQSNKGYKENKIVDKKGRKINMLDEFRIETTSVGQYIDKVEKKKIKADQDVQREFCWSNK